MPESTEENGSSCPACGNSGYITSRGMNGSLLVIHYFCLNCHESWVADVKLSISLRTDNTKDETPGKGE